MDFYEDKTRVEVGGESLNNEEKTGKKW